MLKISLMKLLLSTFLESWVARVQWSNFLETQIGVNIFFWLLLVNQVWVISLIQFNFLFYHNQNSSYLHTLGPQGSFMILGKYGAKTNHLPCSGFTFPMPNPAAESLERWEVMQEWRMGPFRQCEKETCWSIWPKRSRVRWLWDCAQNGLSSQTCTA